MKRVINFIDLFAGIGGMRIGFEQAGCKCVFSSEWDRFAQQTYYANFNEVPEGDIRRISEEIIPNHDILVAGFPCQPFSLAGVSKKNSLGRDTGFLDETQGTLFFEIARILAAKRPSAFLLENVKHILNHDKGRTWRVILQTLAELDYEVFYQIMDGQFYVPQHRERVFVIGFDKRRDINSSCFRFPKSEIRMVAGIGSILEEEVHEKYTLSDNLWGYLKSYARKHKEKGNGFGYSLASLDKPSRTLSARYHKDGSEILIQQEGRNPRRLTPRECARLQGFSDDYRIVVSDSQAYKQFGNSVVVPMVRDIAQEIVKVLKV